MSRAGIATIIIAAVVLLFGGWGVASYNRLVRLDQSARAQWAQVENVYQRRADLVPNLVETVRGAAEFERGTLTAVTEARAKVGQVSLPPDLTTNPNAFRSYQDAQDKLGSALSRLLVVAERYPTLTATQNFRDLQAQLEGTENRIAVERMRYNDAARSFDTARSTFPTTVVASLFGDRFKDKAYFTSTPGAAQPPKVKF